MKKIQITSHNWNKIMQYALTCKWEISGFGHYSIKPDGSVIIDEIFPLFPQICTGTETEIIKSSMTALAESPFSKRTNVWWHSHVNMGVFWSAVDKDCIDGLGGRETALTNLLSIVVNKRSEYRMRFDHYEPYPMFLDNIPLEIIPPSLTGKEKYNIRREVESKVKFKEIKTVVYNEKAPIVYTNKDFRYTPKNEKPNTETTITSNVKMGICDNTIPLAVEEDLIKNGYVWDETLQDWIMP